MIRAGVRTDFDDWNEEISNLSKRVLGLPRRTSRREYPMGIAATTPYLHKEGKRDAFPTFDQVRDFLLAMTDIRYKSRQRWRAWS